MARPENFGYFLIGLSAIFFALHWQQWREWIHAKTNTRRREFVRRQLQRRMVASGLIGVVGAAITLANQLPPNPAAMTAYLCALLLAGGVILAIALADPRNLNLIDELSILLGKRLHVKVATLSQISDLLKKTEQSQRVLDEVTEGFALDVVGDEENQDETLSIDRLTGTDSDIAPVIKLVDTTIFNALERRAYRFVW